MQMSRAALRQQTRQLQRQLAAQASRSEQQQALLQGHRRPRKPKLPDDQQSTTVLLPVEQAAGRARSAPLHVLLQGASLAEESKLPDDTQSTVQLSVQAANSSSRCCRSNAGPESQR
jgi:hypothetical protein